MKDILYGVKLVILEEIDKTTQLPVEDGAKCRVNTGDSAGMDPVLSDGSEDVMRTDERILAIARTPDLLYGYDVTLKDNTFDSEIAALIEGGVIETDAEGNATGYRAPMISEGSTNMKPFRAKIYVANYEGDSIKDYAVITLNNCSGKAPAMNVEKAFYAPEYEIKAREATRAGLPIKSISHVNALPEPDAPTITEVTVGTLSSDVITNIPSGTSVSTFLAGVTTSAGASKKIVNANGYDVTTGNITTGMKCRVFLPTEINAKTDYPLTVSA